MGYGPYIYAELETKIMWIICAAVKDKTIKKSVARNNSGGSTWLNLAPPGSKLSEDGNQFSGSTVDHLD